MHCIVSHPDKQHVNALLQELQEKEWLKRFYTSFAYEKFPLPIRKILPKPLDKQLRKRSYIVKDIRKVHTFPLPFLRHKVAGLDFLEYQRIYDEIIGKRLGHLHFDVFIAYENANLASFRTAKAKGKITILDLAAVHHHHQYELYDRYEKYRRLYSSEAYFRRMNQRKEEAFQYTDYVFCLSSYACETLIKGGIPEGKIFIIPLGVNHALFQPKKEYSKQSEKLRILFVGRMSSIKGLDVLLDAFTQLDPEKLNLRLVGPQGNFDTRRLPSGVQYRPFLPHADLVKEYQQADVFVTPSYTDSWAQTVIEAMACGTPAIVTENMGAKDAVEQGGGFVIPVNDASALKEKIQYFYQNREAIERMGRRAHLTAQQYSLQHYHQKVTSALHEIAQREGIPFS